MRLSLAAWITVFRPKQNQTSPGHFSIGMMVTTITPSSKYQTEHVQSGLQGTNSTIVIGKCVSPSDFFGFASFCKSRSEGGTNITFLTRNKFSAHDGVNVLALCLAVTSQVIRP